MLKYTIFALLLGCLYQRSEAQSRYYLGKENEIITDSSKAIAYILVEQDKANQSWKMRQYTMDDSLALTGTYKDSQLKIPNGKFEVYYTSTGRSITSYNAVLHRIDTVIIPPKNFVRTTGSFLNGEKDGEWIDYTDSGKMEFSNTYKNGKLNGIARTYNTETQKKQLKVTM